MTDPACNCTVQPGYWGRQTLKQASCLCEIAEETRKIVATRHTTALAAAAKSKAAVAILATLVALGTLGGGTVAAASGAFGQQVKAQVESCKDALANGVHGIGDCVSDFAQQHGVQQRQQHSQAHPARQAPSTHGR